MAKKCPKCETENGNRQKVCKCGHEFVSAADGDVARKPRRKKRRAEKITYRKLAKKLAEAPKSNGNGLLVRHLATIFAALEAVLDLDDADPQIANAFASHKEAIEILNTRH